MSKFKSGSRLNAERFGYSVTPMRVGYIVTRDDGGPVPVDTILQKPIAFATESTAWLAAEMFHRGFIAGSNPA